MSYSHGEASWCSDFKAYFNNVIIVAGNHDDGSDGNIDQFAAACGYPLTEPLTGQYAHLYYFDYPQASPLIRIIMASPDIFDSYGSGTPGFTFTRDAIRNARTQGIPWVAVGMHKVCIEPTGDKSCEIGTSFWDMLLTERVDLVLQAHAHTYSRSHQLNCASPDSFTASCIVDSDSQFAKGAGTVLVIQGIGGAGIRSSGWNSPDSDYFATTKGGDGCSGSIAGCPSGDDGMVQYTVTDASLEARAFFNSGQTFDPWSIGQAGPPPPPGPPSASFTYNPASPVAGQALSFSGTATGGTPPYTYSWVLGDGQTSTGQSITHSYSTAGVYTVVLTVTDSTLQTALASNTLTVRDLTTAQPGPVIVGWGGSRLEETSTFSQPLPSIVFPGEQASNQELQVQRLSLLGFNAIRVSFESACTSRQEMGPYDAGNLERSIAIAEHYGFWIIVDYHGYDDLVSPAGADCWLGFWAPVVQQFKGRYDKIVWEPLNEPTGFGDDVPHLSAQYQRWVDQARLLGDTHWIVVQNVCSYGCGLSNWADGFPTVSDPEGRIFISLHSYMGFPYVSPWDLATAEDYARQYYQAVLDGSARTGWPVLNTEGGADELCDNCAPDEVLTGSAGYTTTTLHFIQTLTDLYDSNTPQRINWVWWTMGSWTNTPGAGLYGSLQCASTPPGWGCLLQFQPVTSIGNLPPVLVVPPAQVVNEGETIVLTVTATDPNIGQTIMITANSLPSGSVFDPTSGSFRWTPTESQGPGNYAVSFTATDTGSPQLTDSKTITITVNELNNAPVLAVIGNQATDEGVMLTFSGTATDSDIPTQTLTFSLGAGAPSGASITALGVFKWTPTEIQGPNTYDVTITVSDGSLTDSETIRIAVSEANLAPALGVPGPQTVYVGDTLTFTITATDPDLPTNAITLSATSLTAGMTFNPATGELTFVPASDQAGQTFTVNFTARDDGTPSLSVTGSVPITVGTISNRDPVLNPVGGMSVDESTALTFTATATDPDSGQRLTFSLGPGAPTGASITANGLFAWTPSEAEGPGTYQVTVIVTDNGTPMLSDSEVVTIAVNEANLPPVLDTMTGKSVDEGSLLSFTATATDPDLPAQSLTFSLEPGAPLTASVTADGIFTWRPSEGQGPGTYTVTFRVFDGSASDTETVSIAVAEINSPPTIASPAQTQSVTVGGTLILSIPATDPDAPPNLLTMSAEGLVAGMSFPASTGSGSVTGSLTFTPSSDQSNLSITITLVVLDDGNPQLNDRKTVTINVQPGTPTNSRPTLNVPDHQTIDEGQMLAFAAIATDPDPGQTISLACVNCSSLGATFDVSTGQFSWTPSEAQGPGQYIISFTASDGLTTTAAMTTVNVGEVNQSPVLSIPETLHVREGDQLRLIVNATDPDLPSNRLEVSVSGLPEGASFDPASRVFTWNLSSVNPGVYYVTFTATDNGTPSSSFSKTLKIIADRGDGRCFICEILPPLQSGLLTNVWLMTVGGLLGLTMSLYVYFHRAQARLAKARRRQPFRGGLAPQGSQSKRTL